MPGTEMDPFYQAVVEGFRALGAANPQAIRRAVLLRGLFFAGQQFQCDGMKAIWLSGKRTVEFYDEQGRLLRSFRADEAPLSKAA